MAIGEVSAKGSALNKVLSLICSISLALSMAVPNATALAATTDSDTATATSEVAVAAGQEAVDTAQDAPNSEAVEGGETEGDEATADTEAVTDEEIAAFNEHVAAAASVETQSTGDVTVMDKWDGTTIDTSWYNTTDTSFTISTAAQLAGLAAITSPANDYDAWQAGTHNSRVSGIAQDNFKGKTVTLAADIDMGSKRMDPISEINNWGGGGQGTSNGTYDGVSWQGTFDGAGHTIKNVEIDGSVNCSTHFGGYQGLFSALGIGGVVKNLGVEGGMYGRVVGGIVGCTNTDNFEADTLTTSIADWPTIKNCWSDVDVTSNGSTTRGAGGIFGGESDHRSMVNIFSCYARGDVSSSSGASAGGIAGRANGIVANCYSTGSVTSGNNASAIVNLLYPPEASNSEYKAIGAYVNNYALNNTADYTYTIAADQTVTSRTMVTDGFYTAAQIKDAATTLGSSMEADTSNINGGYPVLVYQNGKTITETSIEGATLSQPADQAYTGKEIKPAITVTLNGTTLTEGSDFYVAYANNIAAGVDTATATVYGVGNYNGVAGTVKFTIKEINWDAYTIDAVSPQWSYGASEPAKPALTVKDADGNALKQGTDYDVVYTNNVEAGTATAGIAPVGTTDVKKSVEFKVAAAPDSPKGSGTAEDPYLLSNKYEYQYVSHQIDLGNETYMKADYKVANDFSLAAGENEPAVDPWGTNYYYKNSEDKIVYMRHYFCGNIDGDGHTITLAIDSASVKAGSNAWGALINYAGIYSGKNNPVTTMTIKDLTVDGYAKTAQAAGFVAQQSGASIVFENCTNKANITVEKANEANGAGFVASSAAALTFTNCVNEGTISALQSSARTAGFVAYRNTGDSEKTNPASGLLTITDCVNKGSIAGTSYAAGFVAFDRSVAHDLTITDCANLGDISSVTTSAGYTAGIYGYGCPSSAVSAINLVRTYNAGAITIGTEASTDQSGYAGGLVSVPSFGDLNITDCYNVGAVKIFSPKADGTYAPNSAAGGLVAMDMPNSKVNGTRVISGYNAGAVSGGSNAGTFLGLIRQSNRSKTGAYTFSGAYQTQDSLEALGATWDTYSAGITLTNNAKSYSAADLKANNPSSLGLGDAFAKDSTSINNGYPVLRWQTATSIADAVVTMPSNITATGSALTVVPEKVVLGETELKYGTDYTISYTDASGNAVSEVKDAGNYIAVIKGIGDYKGSVKAKFTVTNYLTVKLQINEGEAETVGTLTKSGLAGLAAGSASNTQQLAYVYGPTRSGGWQVGVTPAKQYVTLEDLFASISYDEGTLLDQYNTDIDNTSVQVTFADATGFANTQSRDDLKNGNYYPATTASAISTEGQTPVSAALALQSATGAITNTASDTADSLVSEVSDATAPRIFSGTTEEQAAAGSSPGRRLVSNVSTITIKVVNTTPITDASVTMPAKNYWTGEALGVVPDKVVLDGVELTLGTDYKVAGYTDADGKAVESVVDEGDYKIVLEGIGAYRDTITASFSVIPYLQVYTQVANGAKQLVKTYTEADIESLADIDSKDAVSGLYSKGGWKVDTTTRYVKLSTIFTKLGLTKYYSADADAKVEFLASDGFTSGEIGYDQLENGKFFPETTADELKTDNAVAAPAVLGLSDMSNSIASGETAADTQTKNAASQDTNYALRAITGFTAEQAAAGEGMAGKRLNKNVNQIVLKCNEPVIFKVMVKKAGESVATVAKGYTEPELIALKSEGDPVSGMFYKEGWRVASSDNYITLEDLFADAGVDWDENWSLTYGGDDPGSAGKQAQTHSYESIAEQCWFFPDASGSNSDNPDKKVAAPAVLTITEYSCQTGTSIAATAADAQEYNIANAESNNFPRIIYGITEDAYKAASHDAAAGMRYWSRCSYVTVSQDTPISDASVTMPSKNYYTGEALEVVPDKVVLDGEVLTLGTDYKVAGYTDADGNPVESVVNAGDYKIVLEGIGAYAGTVTADFSVVPYLQVYKQINNAAKVLVKTFTEKEVKALASADTTDPITGLYHKKVWRVDTTTSYVKLSSIINASGLSEYYTADADAKVEFLATDGFTSGVIDYDQLVNGKFFPETTADELKTDTAVAAPAVLGLSDMSGVINDGETAAEAQTRMAASQDTNYALRAIMGFTAEQAAAGEGTAGSRLNKNVNTIVLSATVEVPVDKSALEEAILAANTAADGVKVSTDGSDVSISDKWVTQADMDALNKAIEAATGVVDDEDATQDEVDAAVKALTEAIDAFKAAEKDGTKVDPVPEPADKGALESAIASANKETGYVTTSEDGTDVPSTQLWVTPAELDSFKAVIAEAQAVLDDPNATQEEVDAAAAEIEEALEAFKSTEKIGRQSEPQLVERVSGYEAENTSVSISQKTFDSAKTVVIANDRDFMDSMSATGLAGALDAPILLVNAEKGLYADVAAEIERLGATDAYVIGGPNAITSDIEGQLEAYGVTAKRVYGTEAPDTSVECAKEIASVQGGYSFAVIARSDNFQDALSMSSFAYSYGVPIILAPSEAGSAASTLPEGAPDVLNAAAKNVFVAGGTGAIADAVTTGVTPEVVRLAGNDGFDTSNQIASYMIEKAYLGNETVVVASGASKPAGLDALSGAALAGKANAAIILANTVAAMDDEGVTSEVTIKGTDSEGTKAYLSANASTVSKAYILGGTTVMPNDFVNEVETILRSN